MFISGCFEESEKAVEGYRKRKNHFVFPWKQGSCFEVMVGTRVGSGILRVTGFVKFFS